MTLRNTSIHAIHASFTGQGALSRSNLNFVSPLNYLNTSGFNEPRLSSGDAYFFDRINQIVVNHREWSLELAIMTDFEDAMVLVGSFKN